MSESTQKAAPESEATFTLNLQRADEPNVAAAAKREPEPVTLKKGGRMQRGAARWVYERLCEVELVEQQLLYALLYLSLDPVEQKKMAKPRCNHQTLQELVAHQLLKVVTPPPPPGTPPEKKPQATVQVPNVVKLVVRSAVAFDGDRITLEEPYAE